MISKLLKDKVLIGYDPLSDEIDYCSAPFPIQNKKHFVVSDKKDSDPFSLALLFSEKFKNEDVAVLIPGKEFDTYGTRHGRGGGWYDKFLSQIPKHWSRVGVAHISKFHDSKLERQIWDQPVDWVITHNGSNWSLYQTFARYS